MHGTTCCNVRLPKATERNLEKLNFFYMSVNYKISKNSMSEKRLAIVTDALILLEGLWQHFTKVPWLFI